MKKKIRYSAAAHVAPRPSTWSIIRKSLRLFLQLMTLFQQHEATSNLTEDMFTDASAFNKGHRCLWLLRNTCSKDALVVTVTVEACLARASAVELSVLLML